MSTAPIHVAAYRFVALPDAAAWRERIAEAAGDLGVVGTVLVAEEGINLALAGAPAAIDVFLGWLQEEERFAGLGVHRTRCAVLPYRRLRVRHKPEIIRMNQADVRPQDGRAPSVAPRTLRRWLAAGCDDAGREVMLLDTRNSFEVERGRFHNARHWSLARFSDFPAAALAHAEELRGMTVVSYCTGGIRCEKAALFLSQSGIADALQLEGGILGHFRDTGGVGYDGDCVVFDDRHTLGPAL